MQTLYTIVEYHLGVDDRHTFRTRYKYQIILVIYGSCQFCTDNQKHLCHTADIVLLKPGQTLEPSTHKNSCSLLCVSIPEESLCILSDATCNLTENFQFAPYGTNVIHADIKSFMMLRNMVTKLNTLEEENIRLGTELYEKSLFTTFLVLFLRTCVQNDQVYRYHQKKMLVIDDVFEYISQHLTEDLSLRMLEKELFISGEHISREFKKNTGITLHRYITRLRIDLSKKYLLQGISVRDVCQMCGFSSYNHFFKTFRKECGITPMEYYQQTCGTGG